MLTMFMFRTSRKDATPTGQTSKTSGQPDTFTQPTTKAQLQAMEADSELAGHVAKATDAEEVAPHRESVKRMYDFKLLDVLSSHSTQFQSCIDVAVYTWDHESSMRVWTTLKTALHTIPSGDVQVFKGLVLTLTILQTGHPIVSHGQFQ